MVKIDSTVQLACYRLLGYRYDWPSRESWALVIRRLGSEAKIYDARERM